MKTFLSIVLAGLLIAAPLSNAALFGKDDPDEERKELQEARQNALDKLYKERPSAREEIKDAKGYAVFSSIGLNVFLISTENGSGILRNNQTGKDIYMRMFSGGGGIGLGVKDFNAVFIFHTAAAMEKFRSGGWDFSGKADAAAKSGEKGAGTEAAATVVEGTTIYQLTDAGVALQATLQGTKFWENEDLN